MRNIFREGKNFIAHLAHTWANILKMNFVINKVSPLRVTFSNIKEGTLGAESFELR